MGQKKILRIMDHPIGEIHLRLKKNNPEKNVPGL
jgi:hypothetical protein